jgi:cyanophycinase
MLSAFAPRLIPIAGLLALAGGAEAQDPGPRPAKPADLTVYLTGNAADAPNQAVGGPALLLMGGGSEVTSAFRNRAYPIINGGDIVVLRVTGTDGYNSYFYQDIYSSGPLRPHSVETIVLTSRTLADSDYVVWALDTAEMIWFAGGDQGDYLTLWAGTRTQEAVQRAWDRGAVIGGTSAGLAIMGEFIYAPIGVSSATSSTVLQNPYHSSVQLHPAFVATPWMRNTITDSHYRERDRLGRSVVFMARLRADGWTERVRMIGISERTALFIGPDGIGHVSGNEAVYIIDEGFGTQLVQIERNRPLVYTGLLRWRLPAGSTFDFNRSASTIPAMPLSVDASNPSAPFTPTDPYRTWSTMMGSYLMVR